MNRDEMIKLLKALTTADYTGGTDGGLMNAAQAKKFFRKLTNYAILKDRCRTVMVGAGTEEISKIGVNGRALQPKPTENTAADSEVAFTTGVVSITTKSMVAPYTISFEASEDTIEGADHEKTLSDIVAEQIAYDIEDISVNGDTESDDDFLAQYDGWLKLMETGGHDVALSAATITKTTFSKVLLGLPVKYRRDKNKLKFICSPTIEQNYRDYLAGFETAGGDKALTEAGNLKAYGVEIVPVPAMPEAATGNILFITHYQNLIVSMRNQIRVLKDVNIFNGSKLSATHLRAGAQIEETDAIAYTNDINRA